MYVLFGTHIAIDLITNLAAVTVWRMKHTFARDIFNAVAEATLTAKSPSYSTVLDLDRKVRELSFPAAFKPYVSKEDGEEEYYSSSLSLRGFYASQHRTAMLDHPSNPLLSPFAPSFLTAYRCASIIIKATAHQYDRCAKMAMRVWFLLYHTFSAAVSKLPRAISVLANNIHSGPPSAFKSPRAEGSDDDGGDELAIFGGQKRVLTRKHRHANSTSSASPSIPSDKNSPRLASYNNSPSPPSTGAASPSSATTKHGEAATVSHSDSQHPTNVHPSLMEYLSDSNMFGLESMGGAHGSNRGNPFGGPTLASEVSTGNSAPVNGGMGEMYQSFMSYLANRSFGGNALSGQLSPPLPRPVEHVQQQQPQHQYFTPSQPLSALQSRGLASPHLLRVLPNSVVCYLCVVYYQHWQSVHSAEFTMWAQTHDSSVPASPAVLQGMVTPNYMRSELLGYAGSLGSTHRQLQQSAQQTQQTPGFPGFNGRIDANMFGNMYAETQLGHPAFGVHERAPNGSGMMAVDPREEMVEMGLSTESGMDAGWMSFMHNAGIMEYNGPGGGQHQTPLDRYYLNLATSRGGFGGDPGQSAHLLATYGRYALYRSLERQTSRKDRLELHREKMYKFFMSLKQPDGSFPSPIMRKWMYDASNLILTKLF
ncbi:zinc cluster transcription factor [Salix suchowensis]|nr:zinc cluster transcription factor [Salix suchowensis]